MGAGIVACFGITSPLVSGGLPAKPAFHVETFHHGVTFNAKVDMSDQKKEHKMAVTHTPGSIKVFASENPLSNEEQDRMNAYWRAANYLSVGQIYLLANPLLREPLKIDHIKPRLLGHWGTTPGPKFHLTCT